MNAYTLSTRVPGDFDATVHQVRDLLGEAGFGVLTEIDLQATLRAKLGVDVPRQVILGACRPLLAHRALQIDPRVATLLPCNVVVAEEGVASTRVEVFDPALMASFSGGLVEVAQEARTRLSGMMTALEATHAARA